MREAFDVVIVGGGMVGAALGAALTDTTLRTAVIEETPPAPFAVTDPHDLRVSALSIASKRILTGIGAWDRLLGMRVCPFRRMRVWESGAETEFCSDAAGQPALGYIAENRLIQLAAWQCLEDASNIEQLCPGTLAEIAYHPGASLVKLTDGRELQARVLVGADGAQSRVRATADIGLTSWDYEQQALVLYVETGYPQQDVTWQQFRPHGPVAFLPLTGAHASLVWYERPEIVRRLRALPEEDLLTELLIAFPPCLGDIKRIIGRASFSLRRQHAHHYARPGVALVGDAAHTIHPLAGQGVNIGLLDAAALAEVLAQAAQTANDLASIGVLRRYERMRWVSNLMMQTTSDLFYRVFGNDIMPLKILRNAGLGLAQRIVPAKRLAMRYAMGLEGSLPRLARGMALAD